MSYTKTILCLAASRKHGDYCFAGKDVNTGEWIRPVSNRPDEEISFAECTMPTGIQAGLLDILEIPFLKNIEQPAKKKPAKKKADKSRATAPKRTKKRKRA